MYLGLQEQLYEPWVLVQEAFGWQLFILTAWASPHSSMSEREHTFRHNQATTNVNQKNVSRRRLLLLQRPCNGRKTQKASTMKGVRNMI